MGPHPDLRVSDADRDEVVELLHEHRMAGRLDADEHEERVAQACGARYGRDLGHALRELPLPAPPAASVAGTPPVFVQPRPEGGGMAVGFSVMALLVLLFTGGAGALLALPLGATAWAVAARSEHRRGLRLAVTATAVSVLALALWAVWLLVGVAAFIG